MKIYTKGGDRGTTGMLDGRRLSKADTLIVATGTVDELNATLGVAIAALRCETTMQSASSAITPPGDQLRDHLLALQPDLFAIGSHLSAPVVAGRGRPRLPRLPVDRVAEMERWIDEADAVLPPLRKFIMPGGSPVGAALHLSRTVCRRAERAVVALAEDAGVATEIIVYLNRLSDYLFVAARLANHAVGQPEVQWLPAVFRDPSPSNPGET